MMVFIYVSARSIPLFSNILCNMNLYMTVIFQNQRSLNAVVQSLIIDNIHPSVYWSGNREKANLHWIICLGISFMVLTCGLCFQSYCKWFLIAYNGSLLIIILNIDLTVWKIEYGKQTDKEIYCTINRIWHRFRIMQQSLI